MAQLNLIFRLRFKNFLRLDMIWGRGLFLLIIIDYVLLKIPKISLQLRKRRDANINMRFEKATVFSGAVKEFYIQSFPVSSPLFTQLTTVIVRIFVRYPLSISLTSEFPIIITFIKQLSIISILILQFNNYICCQNPACLAKGGGKAERCGWSGLRQNIKYGRDGPCSGIYRMNTLEC